jgi:hypothetical protein
MVMNSKSAGGSPQKPLPRALRGGLPTRLHSAFREGRINLEARQ